MGILCVFGLAEIIVYLAKVTPFARRSVYLPPCPDTSPTLVGLVMSNQSEQVPTLLEERFSFLKPGGDYHPPDCTAQQRTAIIIPYRDRWIHLHILLYNLIPFLVRQQASFTIFVIELALPTTFNRALLLNVGVLESLKRDNYTCFIFHDVDLIPLDDHNLYRCGSSPRHLAVGINKFRYRLPYGTYFGGASALSRDQVFRINGNSNLYFGWGGEDDDSFYRTRRANMTVVRYPVQLARYDMIRHAPDKGNEVNPKTCV
ncbi:hypothetical protein BaRGS_00027882 [Batillaria attramentaria]|uniref:Beta-1,4-N-acetylgalactosaminyltransferase bre-4 n=1 Tax=Batillaria attramentaria TaxID=370345 RepID=A0ABD0K1K4_9CAEN